MSMAAVGYNLTPYSRKMTPLEGICLTKLPHKLKGGHFQRGATRTQHSGRNSLLKLRERKISPVVSKVKDSVRIELSVDHQVNFGETVGVLGSSKWLGRWQNPVEMRWSEAGWSVELEGKPGEEAEFKFVVCGGGGNGIKIWENGPNRKLIVPENGGMVRAKAKWDVTDVTLEPIESEFGEPSNGASHKQEVQAVSEPSAELSSFVQSWQGREVNFMRSNQHSRERRGMWDISGLTGPALALVEGDKTAGNWWRKLEVVERILTSLERNERLTSLVYCAIYLQWINTGQIVCVEDGGHHRPNRHAEISRRIFRWLEKDSMQAAVAASPEAVLVMRKIHPRLPAFSSEFTASVPLTRIRDIAHRNDIPHDLKQEIKHTIQNKLHRNAGPEDLIATERLLQRVTADQGQYSPGFVEQLRIFYAELKDFFNASSLTETLEAIRPSLDDTVARMLESFIGCKRAVDGLSPGEAKPQGGDALDTLLAALHALTGLRAALVYHLDSGLRNDAPDDAIAMRQKWRLAEIGLEDYAFVLLSRVVNEVEQRGGAGAVAGEAGSGSARLFDASVGAAVLALRQVGLSGWQQGECACLEHELTRWQGLGMGSQAGVATADDRRWWALRMKASLDRARRLTVGFTETLLALYAVPSQKLGAALSVEENAVRTFAEAEIRASVVFQLDKLASLLLRALRSFLGLQGWDVLMPGTATGVLREVDLIDPASLRDCSHDLVLLVRRAEGDEEVRAASKHIRGVILLQELPHLSHLAVRARQERVPLVTCEDEAWIGRLREMAQSGAHVRLETVGDTARVSLAAETPSPPAVSGDAQPAAGATTRAPPMVSASKEVVHPVLPLQDATLDTCGAKAVACSRLLSISDTSLSAPPSTQSGFFAPRGAVIPFGVLDQSIRAVGRSSEFLDLLRQLEAAPLDSLDQLCAETRSLVASVPLPAPCLQTLSRVFPPEARLIARSSANVEDLAGMSGAGLYDSIPNVCLSDPAAFSAAVSAVWASLYSRRAVLSRRVAGVPQGDAAMAVLVQELVSPNLSFVLHTKSPLDGSDAEVHAEIAPGLGETLASGARGTAWRVAVEKATGAVRVVALANFSEKLVVVPTAPGDGTVVRRRVDYSRQQLSVSRDSLDQLAKRLCAVGQLLEQKLGGAQDVEGCVLGDNIIVVQSRPQP